ncbi:MAG: hypothetical protein AVDCRST_MAG73-3274, partial [uncultured Thermomicrobiales bacterium]
DQIRVSDRSGVAEGGGAKRPRDGGTGSPRPTRARVRRPTGPAAGRSGARLDCRTVHPIEPAGACPRPPRGGSAAGPRAL